MTLAIIITSLSSVAFSSRCRLLFNPSSPSNSRCSATLFFSVSDISVISFALGSPVIYDNQVISINSFKRCCCFYQSHLVWGHYFKHINEELWWLTEWTLPYTVIITGNCTCLWPWQINTTSCVQCYGIYLQNIHVHLYTAIVSYLNYFRFTFY